MYLFFTVLCRAPSLHCSILNNELHLSGSQLYGMVWFMEWLILVYIINRIIHGRLEIWNLSSRIHIRYLARSLRSLVRYRCEHSKINSISPRDHVLFSIYVSLLPLELEKLLMNDKITASCQSDIFHKHFIKC